MGEKYSGGCPPYPVHFIDKDDVVDRDWRPDKDGSIIFEKRFGPKKYTLEAADNETTERWKTEVLTLSEVLKTRDPQNIVKVLRVSFFQKNFSEILKNLEKDKLLDDEDFKLLAISLWVIEAQGEWHGMNKVAGRILQGGHHTLTQLVEEELPLACLDSSSLVEYLTHVLGINGKIHRTRGKYSHRYWRSEGEESSGKVIDTWWGFRQGGFFRDFSTYRKAVGDSRTLTRLTKELK